MPVSWPNTAPHGRWRVAVSRDEDSDGRALRRYGFAPIPRAVVKERPPQDPCGPTRAIESRQ